MITTQLNLVLYRAGLKLEAALDHYRVDVRGPRFLDSGLFIGGSLGINSMIRKTI